MRTIVQKKLIVKLKEIRKELVSDQVRLKKQGSNKNQIIGFKIHYINAILDLVYGKRTNDGMIVIGQGKIKKRVPVEFILNMDLQRFIRKIDTGSLVHLVPAVTIMEFKNRGSILYTNI